MYAAPIDEIATAIRVTGHKVTTLVEGDMGCGKSSILKMLAAELPTHTPCYFDCTTKDLGDIMIPNIQAVQGEDAVDFVSFATNEELGVHLNKPIILMLDEYGKANPSVKNACLRLMLERQIGSRKLHPESIIFATTNLGAEGVGDLLMPHHRNRMSVVQMRKPNNLEWIEWGLNNNIDPSILGWVKDNPHLLHGFQEVGKPEDNEYIFHPQSQRTAFVTPRSLEKASDWLHNRAEVSHGVLMGALIGTIGDRGALDLMTFVSMADQLPSLESIQKDPMNALVPTSPAAVCMVVYRSLSAMDRTWMDAWMDYMVRLDKEAQGMFANGVRSDKYAKQQMVLTNKKFTDWAVENNYMFTADKK